MPASPQQAVGKPPHRALQSHIWVLSRDAITASCPGWMGIPFTGRATGLSTSFSKVLRPQEQTRLWLGSLGYFGMPPVLICGSASRAPGVPGSSSGMAPSGRWPVTSASMTILN